MTAPRILVVEDEAITAESIRHTLVNLGYQVPAMVASGEEALHEAEALRPDLILMDIRLQGEMDGVAAAEQIRNRFDIPVVYLTAHADKETLQRAKVSEPFGYILKPFRMDDMHSAIEMALYKHRLDKRLRESEERFRRAVLDAPFPIMIHAEGGQVIAINKVWTELTGYVHDDIPTILSWTEKAYGERKELVKADIDRLYDLDRRVEEGEYTVTTKSGEERIWIFSSAPLGRTPDGRRLVISMADDVTERVRVEQERERLILELRDALAKVKALSGLLPICASCKKIRDDQGYWTQVEVYIREHSEADFTHGICPDCARKLYPDFVVDGA